MCCIGISKFFTDFSRRKELTIIDNDLVRFIKIESISKGEKVFGSNYLYRLIIFIQ